MSFAILKFVVAQIELATFQWKMPGADPPEFITRSHHHFGLAVLNAGVFVLKKLLFWLVEEVWGMAFTRGCHAITFVTIISALGQTFAIRCDCRS